MGKQKKVSTRARVKRSDGWFNALTGMGTSDRDKRSFSGFNADVVDFESAANLWRSDDMAARIIETLPDEMTRAGFELKIADKSSQEMTAALDSLNVLPTIRTALYYERAYGGAGVFLGADDGQDWSKPLKLESVRELKFLIPLTPRELIPVAWEGNPRRGNFGKPTVFKMIRDAEGPVQGTEVEVHESRLIRFEGIKTSGRHVAACYGWGDSVLNRCAQVLRDYQHTWQSAALILHDFAGAVMKIKNLAELVASNEQGVLANRLKALELGRSTARVTAIDSEEDWSRESQPVTGLPEMMDKFSLRLAASAKMPVIILMGQSPSGFSSGDGDIRWFYDQVAASQRFHLKPALDKIVETLFRAKLGPTKGKEPETWTVTFPSPWQMSEMEKADLKFKIAQSDTQYVGAGVLLPEEVAVSRFGGDGFGNEITLDTEARAAMATAQAAANVDPEVAANTNPNAPAKPEEAKPAKPAKPEAK